MALSDAGIKLVLKHLRELAGKVKTKKLQRIDVGVTNTDIGSHTVRVTHINYVELIPIDQD
jgi:hypothetical protein